VKNRSPKRPPAAKADVRFRRWAVYFLAAILLLGAAMVWLLGYAARDKKSDDQRQKEDVPQPLAAEQDPFLIPDISPSRFRNATKSVGYVGSDQCLECHRDEHQSYLKTTHSRSLAEVDVSREPPNAEFDHALSGRSYRIYRKGETLRLRESIPDATGPELVLVDQAARFALGSGNYARMYLVKVDDFLIEAPMTWYPRQKKWRMSAGYEKNPLQPGFNREIDSHCLYCHAGRVEMIDGASKRLHVAEMAIGCERCHGPGELHVRDRRAELPIQGGIDDSIVNLRHLSRARQEDVCSQCHLSASADVSVRGRSRADFRPGMRMADFVINYRIDRPDSAMTVSGQIEQMRLSRCYVESKTMTCTTCHDPHSLPDESAKALHFRNKCLSCHRTDSCSLSITAREEKQDHCIACHMPRGPTDIPHFSFTHHRVGIHSEESKTRKLTESDHLVPVVDVAHLPEHEQRRLLGLANDIFAGKLATGLDDESRDDPSYRTLAVVFQNRARDVLHEVRSQGLRDPEIEAFFSRLYWRKNPALCIEYAESALKLPHVSPATRSSVLYHLASSHFDQQRYAQAFPYLQELVKLERSEISLMLLGICHQKLGNLPEAVRLINEAILASPDRADLHLYLASIYQEMGKSSEAERHLQLGKLLQRKVPQPQ
jgi:cytochrome c554/c'-like protein/tetratricopeptide repeat protein